MAQDESTPDLLVFPKFFFQHGPGVAELADRIIECGFDGVDVIIRERAWCKEDDYFESLPAFAKHMRSRGLKVYTATTNWMHDKVAAIEDSYMLFADNGITMFRFFMQRYRGRGTYREDLLQCRKSLERLEELGLQYGITALLQIHGRSLTWSPATASSMVQGLDPRGVAIHYDPGNMCLQEGWTDSVKAVDVLGEYLAYVGAKNGEWSSAPDRDGDNQLKWRAKWTQLACGMIDWEVVLNELKAADYDGPICIHNFYDGSLQELVETTTMDVKYMRRLMKAVWSQQAE
ncbi:sugar phosphate isomerase/epimerase family protein [Candidatus Hydrogenedentota bacterium]